MLGLAGTGLGCCYLPLSKLDNMAVPLPPLPLPSVVSELRAQLEGIGVTASIAASHLSHRTILTCIYMTGGVPGYVALLWTVMQQYWKDRRPGTAAR